MSEDTRESKAPAKRSQHVATLLGATCFVRLATELRHLGCCRLEFENGQTWANNTQYVTTCRNRVAKRTQHVAPNNVATVWRGLKKTTTDYYGVFSTSTSNFPGQIQSTIIELWKNLKYHLSKMLPRPCSPFPPPPTPLVGLSYGELGPGGAKCNAMRTF